MSDGSAGLTPNREVSSTAIPPAAALGDELRAIYRAEFSYVVQSLRRLGVQERDLPDVAHDVFVVVHRILAQYDRSRPLRPWLFGVAFRVASEHRRRAQNQRESVKADIDDVDTRTRPDASAQEAQKRRMVVAALQELDIDKRTVFIQHELDGTPVPAIAEALGIPVNTAYSRLRLARAEFAAAIRRIQGAA